MRKNGDDGANGAHRSPAVDLRGQIRTSLQVMMSSQPRRCRTWARDGLVDGAQISPGARSEASPSATTSVDDSLGNPLARRRKNPRELCSRGFSTKIFGAETEGFEPSNGLPRYHLSRVAH